MFLFVLFCNDIFILVFFSNIYWEEFGDGSVEMGKTGTNSYVVSSALQPLVGRFFSSIVFESLSLRMGKIEVHLIS